MVLCEVQRRKTIYVLKKKRLGEVAECEGGINLHDTFSGKPVTLLSSTPSAPALSGGVEKSPDQIPVRQLPYIRFSKAEG